MQQLSGYGDWLAEQGLSTNTIQQRLDFVARQLRTWGTFDVTPHQVVAWLQGYEGWTHYTYFNHARSVFGFLLETGQLQTSPMARLRRPPQPPPHPSALPPDKVALVLGNCGGDMHTWLLLAYLAGLRAHEIAKIRGEQISPTTLHVVGKGRKSAWLPTHPALWGAAADYPRTGWWFPADAGPGHISSNSISTRIGRYFRRLGIESGAIHRLRHSYATSMSRNGTTPRVIQELMRHSSLATTQMYLDVGADEKRNAIESLMVA